MRWKPKPRPPKPLYALEGQSWFGTKVILLYFRTRLELTGSFLRRVVKGLGGTGVRRIDHAKK